MCRVVDFSCELVLLSTKMFFCVEVAVEVDLVAHLTMEGVSREGCHG